MDNISDSTLRKSFEAWRRRFIESKRTHEIASFYCRGVFMEGPPILVTGEQVRFERLQGTWHLIWDDLPAVKMSRKGPWWKPVFYGFPLVPYAFDTDEEAQEFFDGEFWK